MAGTRLSAASPVTFPASLRVLAVLPAAVAAAARVGVAPFCGCFNDLPSCCLSYFLPCVQFGFNAQAMGDDCCLCCLVSAYSTARHSLLRLVSVAAHSAVAPPLSLLCSLCSYVVSWHFGACCIPHGMLREKIRAKNGLPAVSERLTSHAAASRATAAHCLAAATAAVCAVQEPCNDYCVTCFLPCCSLSQEARTIGAGGGGPGRQTMA